LLVWLAPEVLAGGHYTSAADIYSLGIVLWELITRAEPFSEYSVGQSNFRTDLENEIMRGLRPSINPYIKSDLNFDDTENLCTMSFAHFIDECLNGDAPSRPSASEVRLIA